MSRLHVPTLNSLTVLLNFFLATLKLALLDYVAIMVLRCKENCIDGMVVHVARLNNWRHYLSNQCMTYPLISRDASFFYPCNNLNTDYFKIEPFLKIRLKCNFLSKKDGGSKWIKPFAVCFTFIWMKISSEDSSAHSICWVFIQGFLSGLW